MKTSGTKNIFKNIARFLLGLSGIFFVTTAFEIVPITPNTINFIKTIFLTNNGSNTSATGIILEGSGGHAWFQGSMTVESLSNVGIVGTNASGKFIASTSGSIYNIISGFALAGATGAQGPIGTTGVNGTPGAKGATGDTGVTGTNGTNGINGLTGAKGATGAQGIQGTGGIQGVQGIQGNTGAAGVGSGTAGATGVQGIQGTGGIQGVQGIQGNTGAAGVGSGTAGATGAVGATGATGATGTQIEMGTSVNYLQRRYVGGGRTNLISLASITGPIGNTGATGATGHITVINITQVSSGATSGQCSSTGNIVSFYADSNDNFDYNVGDLFLGNTIICSAGGVGPQGPIGPQGIQGTGGIQGTQGIQGNIGSQGNTGAQGNTGVQGTGGIQGTQGIQGNTGAKGGTGDTGPAGTNGTNGINGLTGATGGTGSTGADGREIEMGTSVNYLQRRYVGGGRTNLISLASITGPIGNTGATGATGHITVINITQVSSGATSGQCSSTGNIVSFYADSNDNFDYNVGDLFLGSTIICSAGGVGPQGPIGPQGNTGSTGAQGIQGTGGIQGIQGNMGSTGATGATGNTGATGGTGAQGIQGTGGIQGIQGIQGNTGGTGAIGGTGAKGTTGDTGPQGTQGVAGLDGLTGAKGVTGAIGATGAQGIQGTGGIQGIQGNTGGTGAIGGTGATGSSFFIQTGSNIYYDLGFLGIGLNNPLFPLDVSGRIHTNLGIQIGSETITASDIANRNGNMHNHSNLSVLNGITATGVSNRNTAYGRGNHASMGYLTGFTEVDPKVGTLVDGKRCYASGTIVVCDQNTPAATPAGYDTQIQFNSGGTTFGSSRDLIWQTGRLGINTSEPSQALDVSGGIKGMDFISSLNNTGMTMSIPFVYSGSNYCLRIENGLIISLGTIDVSPGRVTCVRIYGTGGIGISERSGG